MTVRWDSFNTTSNAGVQSMLETEYGFRTAVTRLFLQNLDDHFHDQIDDLNFEICVLNKHFRLSTDVPKPLYTKMVKLISDNLPTFQEFTYQT